MGKRDLGSSVCCEGKEQLPFLGGREGWPGCSASWLAGWLAGGGGGGERGAGRQAGRQTDRELFSVAALAVFFFYCCYCCSCVCPSGSGSSLSVASFLKRQTAGRTGPVSIASFQTEQPISHRQPPLPTH